MIIVIISAVLILYLLTFLTARVYVRRLSLSKNAGLAVYISGSIVATLFVMRMALTLPSWVVLITGILATYAWYLCILALPVLLAYHLKKHRMVVIGGIGGAFILGTIGLLQATQLTITEYSLSLPEWSGKTAILVSDTHYGPLRNTAAAEKVVTAIEAQNPDIVFHAGDLFDGPEIDLSVLDPWKRLTMPVLLAPGNHDAYGSYTLFMDAARGAGMITLEDEVIEYEGVRIAGLTYRTEQMMQHTEQLITLLNPDIVINHAPVGKELLAAQGVRFLFSGHTHNGQFWPINYITYMIYGNYHYGLHGYQTLSVLTTSGVGVSGIPNRLFNTPELVRITFTD